MDSFWQPPDPGGGQNRGSTSQGDPTQGKIKEVENTLKAQRSVIRKNMLNVQDADYVNLTSAVLKGEVYEVIDFTLCEVCSLPMLFFHDLKFRCRPTEKYDIDDVEDNLIPILLQSPILAKYKSLIESAHLRKHRMDEQRSKGRRKSEADASQRFKPKILDAPLWGKNQHLNFFIEGLLSWGRIHENYDTNEIVYVICIGLEKAERNDVADLIRIEFTPARLESLNVLESIDLIATYLKDKFGKSKREEIEFYYDNF